MSLAAAIGLLRFPDLLDRMHAATKPQVLGLLLLLTGRGPAAAQLGGVPVLLVAWIFQLLTVPVSAHMVGRAGYRTKHLHRELLSVDDLDAVVEAAAEEEPEAEIDAGDAARRRRRGRRCETSARECRPGRRCCNRGRSGPERPGLYRDAQGLARASGGGAAAPPPPANRSNGPFRRFPGSFRSAGLPWRWPA